MISRLFNTSFAQFQDETEKFQGIEREGLEKSIFVPINRTRKMKSHCLKANLPIQERDQEIIECHLKKERGKMIKRTLFKS